MNQVRIGEIIRATEWWEYKLLPILGVFYATPGLSPRVDCGRLAYRDRVADRNVAGAVYVSVINDLTDRDEDRRAGQAESDGGAIGPGDRAAR